MDERRRREPGQEAGVLDRVPSPDPAPAEDLVAPPRAEHDPDRQEAPGEQGPAPRVEQPALTDPAGDEAGDGEGERDAEADVAEVEHRRVDHHQRVVLEERVGAGTARRDGAAHPPERVGRAGQQQEEEGRDGEEHHERPGHERVLHAAPEPQEGGHEVEGEDDRPEEDRALERAPQAGHVVERRRGRGAVVGDEGQREVAGDQRPLHGRHGQHRAGQHQPDVDGARAHEAAAVLHDAEHQRDPTEDGGGQAERDAGHAERAVHPGRAVTAPCRGRGPGSWPCTRCRASRGSGRRRTCRPASDPRRPPPDRPGTGRSARRPGSARGRWRR